VGKYLETEIGSEVKKLSEVSSEITYQIPNALSYKFKDFFTKFDSDLDRLDIRSYGISVTTLEEVFLRVGHGDDTNEDLKIKAALKSQHSEEGIRETDNDDYSISESHE
jgi:ATP-binding cassette subfamily A (ABC1) protein 3